LSESGFTGLQRVNASTPIIKQPIAFNHRGTKKHRDIIGAVVYLLSTR
jgi:hypothetical protein